MRKIIISAAALIAAAAMLFAGCSAQSPAGSEASSEAATQTTVIKSGETVSYVISSDDAKSTAYAELRKKSASGEYGDINNFTFAGVELLGAKQGIYAYNMGYGTDSESENTSGNPYYCVCYNYDPELCDTAYFCIDAITGKLLFSGYMGD